MIEKPLEKTGCHVCCQRDTWFLFFASKLCILFWCHCEWIQESSMNLKQQKRKPLRSSGLNTINNRDRASCWGHFMWLLHPTAECITNELTRGLSCMTRGCAQLKEETKHRLQRFIYRLPVTYFLTVTHLQTTWSHIDITPALCHRHGDNTHNRWGAELALAPSTTTLYW